MVAVHTYDSSSACASHQMSHQLGQHVAVHLSRCGYRTRLLTLHYVIRWLLSLRRLLCAFFNFQLRATYEKGRNQVGGMPVTVPVLYSITPDAT